MPIRILHIVTYMGRGGLETLLMNCFRHIDRDKVQFDFLVHREFRGDYDDEIEALGGKIYRLPRLNPFDPQYKKALRVFFTEHPEYRIVHSHLDCMSAIPLQVAKQCGVPVRIAHSHNSNQDKNLKYLLKRYYMKKIPENATYFFACSAMAGAFMFPGQEVTLINNGIETEKFAFDPEVRAQVRQELSLGQTLTVCHVGRFMPQKNHDFLIDAFEKLHEKMPETKLLLVGEGPLEGAIRKKVQTLGLTEAVRFLGVRADVERILQGADIFVLPSLYEGLGMVAVEAQTSGLPCIVSDRVPEACKMTELVSFLPLEAGAEAWAEEIVHTDLENRASHAEEVCAAGYDIKATAQQLQTFYMENWR